VTVALGSNHETGESQWAEQSWGGQPEGDSVGVDMTGLENSGRPYEFETGSLITVG
jgi:hypothetical protein